MEPTPRPARLAADPTREAVNALRGYAYQIWQSLLAWLQLEDDLFLFLEGAEDVDQLGPSGATTIQVRATTAPITLNSTYVREAIGHFWDHAENNADRVIRYRYVTTARIGHEQPDLGLSEPGLVLWNSAKAAQDWEPAVGAISRHLADDTRLASAVREFVQNATLVEVRDRLIAPIAWDTAAPDQPSIIESVQSALVLLGRERTVDQRKALASMYTLLGHVLAVAQKNDRYLSRADLLDLFESFVHEIADEVVYGPLPPLAPNFHRRPEMNQQIADAISNSGVVLLRGATGIGKTNVATDYSGSAGGAWQRIELRGRKAGDVDHRLRLAIRTLPSSEVTSVVVDDVPLQEDYRQFASSLSQLVELVVGKNGRVILTAYEPMPELLRKALTVDVIDYELPAFEENDIRAFLAESGCNSELAQIWARPILVLTRGHPILVDARIQYLRRRGFPAPSPSRLLETPEDVFDVKRQYQHFIRELPDSEKALLYRMSISTRSLRRDQIVSLGETTINGEEAISHPGDVADRLIGPWLERSPIGRFGVSPLADGSGVDAHGPSWLTGAHRAIGRALLTGSPIDTFDAVSAATHAINGDDSSTLFDVLHAFLFAEDPEFFSKLWEHFEWFAFIGIGVAPIPLLDNVLIATMLRSAQYRGASAGSNAELAARIAEAFEAVVPATGDTIVLRYLFYSIATVYCVESIAAHVNNAFRLISLARALRASTSALAADLAQLMEGGPFATTDVERNVGVTVFQRIASESDLNALVEALRGREAEVVRDFLSDLSDSNVMWNGLVANLIISERANTPPEYGKVVSALVAFYSLCIAVGTEALAIRAVASAARVAAEFADDPARAQSILQDAKEAHGSVPRLRLAEAAVVHVKGDAASAKVAFEEAIASIPYEEDDVEPVNDLRLAAGDAATIGDFDRAATLFDTAATRLGPMLPLYRVGLLFDASYCAWRGGNDARALAFARSGATELAGYDGDVIADDFTNLTRRAGHVIAQMAWDPVSRVDVSRLLPGGYASDLDPLNDPGVTPADLILVLVAQLERRAGDEPTFFAMFRARLESAALPSNALGQIVTLSWAVKFGFVADAVDATVGMRRARDAMAARKGAQPGTTDYEIPLVAAALVAAIGTETLCAKIVQQGRDRAVSRGATLISDWLDKVLRFISEREYAMGALKGSFGDYLSQLGASIVMGADDATSPQLLVSCSAFWIDNLSGLGWELPVDEAILAALRVVWRKCVANRRFFMASPIRTVPPLTAALDSAEGSSWSRIASILLTASEAAGQGIPSRTIDALRAAGGLADG